MRIIHWTDNFLPLIGGIETFVGELARAQIAAGHDVCVISSPIQGRPHEEIMEGVPIMRRPFADDISGREPLRLGPQMRACTELRERFAPDLIHVHFSRLAAWLELVSRPSAPGPVVLTAHAPLDNGVLPDQLIRRILHSATAVAAVSRDLRDHLQNRFFSDAEDSIKVLLNGVASSPLAPAPICQGPPTLVGLGRLVKTKGFDTVLHALAKLPGVRFLLAGDGPELGELQRLATALGVADRVEFRGWIHPRHIPDFINEGDLVVMPSNWREPFGLVAVQAGQMGRPLIASRVGGIPEIVIADQTGLLVPPGEPTAFAEAIRDLFADPARARAMGTAAREHVTDHFSLERCVRETQAIYAHAQQVHYSKF